jgi:2-C-methyl-D-erythritol 4-phosphate cytidylyltransferase
MPDAFPHPSCTAIIVAAGSSRRMGFDKLASPLGGVPVLRRSVEAFLAADSIAAVVLVGPEERWALLAGMDFPKPVTRVDGGAERQDSVARGLAALDPACRCVAVHDGARPLVSPDDIDRCVAAAIEHRAAALARRVAETMKRSDAGGFCEEAVSRENLWCMETPQVFEVSLLREAYAAVTARGLVVTDEVSAVQAIGARVKFVESRHPNLKITTPADLALAEALIRSGDIPVPSGKNAGELT